MTMNGFRWKIEQFQREEKELTGIKCNSTGCETVKKTTLFVLF